jgi:hypothetical protein
MLSQGQLMEGGPLMIPTPDSCSRSFRNAFKLTDDSSLANGIPPSQVRQRTRVSFNPPEIEAPSSTGPQHTIAATTQIHF